jgi:transposase
MGYIEGVDRHQEMLLPPALDDFVSAKNPVRVIDAFVEGLDLQAHGFIRAIPASEGRPGYDPRVLLKLYIYGYVNRTRSSRKLEAETHRNVEVMWLMRMLKPDHKTIAVFRKEHLKALKQVTREFLLICRELHLLDGTLVLIDGSKMRAVNSRDRNFTEARVKTLIQRVEASVARYLKEMDQADRSEEDEGGRVDPDLPRKLERLQARMEELRQIQSQIRDSGDQVSFTDPESRRMKVRGDLDVCYNAQIAVDPKHHLIVAHEVTNEVTDMEQLAPMALAAKEALGAEELEVAADGGYHNGAHVAICEANGITPFVPETPNSKNAKVGLFTKESFRYQEARDAYRCPAGQWLSRTTQHETKTGRLLGYYANPQACEGCPLRRQCTTNKGGRRIMRTPEEAQVAAMRRRVAERRELMVLRKSTVEHPFGTMKRAMDAGYFLLKGLEGVGGEFSLSVLAYNFKRVINTLGVECLLEALRARNEARNRGLSPA